MAKILCIEDEPAIQMLISLELEDCGHETYTASNGQEGLEAVAAELPNLVMCDYMMPVMDGLEFVRALRGQETATSRVPVVMVSAALDPQTISTAEELGVDGFLSKPIDFDELCDFVEGHLAS